MRVGHGRKRSTCWLEAELETLSPDLGRATGKRSLDVVRPPPWSVTYRPSASSPEESLSPQSQAGIWRMLLARDRKPWSFTQLHPSGAEGLKGCSQPSFWAPSMAEEGASAPASSVRGRHRVADGDRTGLAEARPIRGAFERGVPPHPGRHGRGRASHALLMTNPSQPAFALTQCRLLISPLGSGWTDNVSRPVVTLHDATNNMTTLRTQRQCRFHDQPDGPATPPRRRADAIDEGSPPSRLPGVSHLGGLRGRLPQWPLSLRERA